MTTNDIRKAYLDHFKNHSHHIIPSAPIIPENDPTTLFTGSGMQPLVNYFLGEDHPLGTRIVNAQKCFRAEDIDEVGDNRHTTFFEMLGNWSFGDYWKKDQLTWIFEFLTNTVGLDPKKLYITVFSGDDENSIPPDDNAAKIWQKLFQEKGIDTKVVKLITQDNAAKVGMQSGRIFYYDAKKNWWSRSGTPSNMPPGEPGGPDSEIFYEFTQVEHNQKFGNECHPNCDCGRFLEIGNSVFMQYVKMPDGKFEELPNKNIDFGGGLERITAAKINNPDVFMIDTLKPSIEILEKITGQTYTDNLKAFRTISDHIRAAIHIIADGISPSNKMQGYMLRRLIRKSLLEIHRLDANRQDIIPPLVDSLIENYHKQYPKLKEDATSIHNIIEVEASKFSKTLHKGLKEFSKISEHQNTLTGNDAFKLFETFGFPLELSIEAAKDAGLVIDKDIMTQFNQMKSSHADKSRSASKGMFKGGLGGASMTITQYHTATHLLHQALKDVLGNHVIQMGSNITDSRLRFDFKHDQGLSLEEKQQITNIINQKIADSLPVTKTIEQLEEAIKSGATALFNEKYAQTVSVYTIGTSKSQWYSKELCGGPHVENTNQIPQVKITKEKSIGSNTRRVYLEFIA